MFCCFRPILYKHCRLRSKLTSSSFQLIYQFCAGGRPPSKLCKELTGISHEAVTAWGTEDVSSPSLLRIEAESSWISKLLQVSVHIPSAVLPYPAGTAFRTFWEPHLDRCSWESGSVIHTEFSENLRVEGSVLSVDSVVTSEVQFKEKPVIPSQSLPTPGPKPPRREELVMHDLAQASAKRSIQIKRIVILAELGKNWRTKSNLSCLKTAKTHTKREGQSSNCKASVLSLPFPCKSNNATTVHAFGMTNKFTNHQSTRSLSFSIRAIRQRLTSNCVWPKHWWSRNTGDCSPATSASATRLNTLKNVTKTC